MLCFSLIILLLYFIDYPKSVFKLEGIIVFISNGDRGPTESVQDMETINCGTPMDQKHTEYSNFLKQLTSKDFLGPFKTFPLQPDGDKCIINELTPVGVSQLLSLGTVLRSVYKPLIDGTSFENISIHSFKDNSTFQSALAFAYAFLSQNVLSKVTYQISKEYNFCSTNCQCPITNDMKKEMDEKILERYVDSCAYNNRDPLRNLNEEKYTNSPINNPYKITEPILTYLCHRLISPFCKRFLFDKQNQFDIYNTLNFIEKDLPVYAEQNVLQKYARLKFYDMVLNMARDQFKQICSGKKSVFLYSGLDTTLKELLIAFGVINPQYLSPSYASRLVFEVYSRGTKIVKPTDTIYSHFYFRIIFNGQDITNSIEFCNEPQKIIKVLDKGFLCPLGLAINFIENEYFNLFSVSSFNKACNV